MPFVGSKHASPFICNSMVFTKTFFLVLLLHRISSFIVPYFSWQVQYKFHAKLATWMHLTFPKIQCKLKTCHICHRCLNLVSCEYIFLRVLSQLAFWKASEGVSADKLKAFHLIVSNSFMFLPKNSWKTNNGRELWMKLELWSQVFYLVSKI